MNYYEELGLTESASADEIRQAYRKLARLLHPDHQSDADLRKIAELQMARINEILAALSDPARRERYDATLGAGPIGRHSNLSRTNLLLGKYWPSAGTIIWSAFLMVAAFGLAWVFLYFEHDSGVFLYRTTEDPGHQASAQSRSLAGIAERESVYAGVRRVEPVQRRGQSPAPTRTLAPQVPASAEPYASRGVSQGPGIVLSQPDIKLATEPAAPSSASAPVSNAKPADKPLDPLIGTWLYVKSAIDEGSHKNFSYRPEYIEMVIKPGPEGKVLGRYSGRFHVPDRPISAEVVFQFEGLAGQGSNVFSWRGTDGANGQIQMKFISGGVMEVSWYTTRFGTVAKLASGTAVMFRN